MAPITGMPVSNLVSEVGSLSEVVSGRNWSLGSGDEDLFLVRLKLVTKTGISSGGGAGIEEVARVWILS